MWSWLFSDLPSGSCAFSWRYCWCEKLCKLMNHLYLCSLKVREVGIDHMSCAALRTVSLSSSLFLFFLAVSCCSTWCLMCLAEVVCRVKLLFLKCRKIMPRSIRWYSLKMKTGKVTFVYDDEILPVAFTSWAAFAASCRIWPERVLPGQRYFLLPITRGVLDTESKVTVV